MIKSNFIRTLLGVLALAAGSVLSQADVPVSWHVSLTGQASNGSLAPYMLGSWNEGRYAEGNGIWQEAGISKSLDLDRRFSWSAGVGYIAGAASKIDYDRWNSDSESWGVSKAHMPYFRLTQIFAQVKYRGAYLMAGMKNNHSGIVDDRLSSGDLTRSNNAASIPGIAAGFIDFQNIPFTNGWLQIDGEIMYGKMMDSGFKRSEFNYYSGVEALNLWYNYKRCYFRTNPEKNFHVTVGMQAAAMFGGSTYTYRNGTLNATEHRGFNLKDALQMFLPIEGGEDYYKGSHLGSWDFKAVYRFRDGERLSAYFEWPWEDGSGIGKMNGWDGLWGIQFDFAHKGIVTKAVVEYLDFTNQSGPFHFDPDDNPDSPLAGHAEGADSYYNNDYYGGYTNYGMSIGTPYLLAPIYNHNGMLEYLHNRARGFHAAVEGNPTDRIGYRVKIGYENAGGYGRIPDFRRSSSVSGMVDASFKPVVKIPELQIGLGVAFDKGSLRGDNFGARLQIAYTGDFTIKK